MACLNTLKEEIKILESVFPKHHERFQIHFATMDELCGKFVISGGKTYEINANITVRIDGFSTEYPRSYAFFILGVRCSIRMLAICTQLPPTISHRKNA